MLGTRILALGNVLVSDDAVGPYLLASLHAHWDFPDGIDLVDAGTPGFDLLPMIEDAYVLVLLDSVSGPGPPGSVHLSDRDQIIGGRSAQQRGPHDPSLRAVLLEAEMREIGPKHVFLVGVVPQYTRAGTLLTDVVRAAVPEAENQTIELLRNLGYEPIAKNPPEPVCVWWEEGSSQHA